MYPRGFQQLGLAGAGELAREEADCVLLGNVSFELEGTVVLMFLVVR